MRFHAWKKLVSLRKRGMGRGPLIGSVPWLTCRQTFPRHGDLGITCGASSISEIGSWEVSVRMGHQAPLRRRTGGYWCCCELNRAASIPSLPLQGTQLHGIDEWEGFDTDRISNQATSMPECLISEVRLVRFEKTLLMLHQSQCIYAWYGRRMRCGSFCPTA